MDYWPTYIDSNHESSLDQGDLSLLKSRVPAITNRYRILKKIVVYSNK